MSDATPGSAMSGTCPRCGAPNLGTNFCEECGAPFGARIAPVQIASPPTPIVPSATVPSATVPVTPLPVVDASPVSTAPTPAPLEPTPPAPHAPRRIDRRVLVGAGAVVVAAAVVVGIVLFGGSPSTSGGSGEAQAVSTSLAALTSKPKSLEPKSLEADLAADVSTAVPAGSTVTTVADSWQPRGSGSGIIVVSVVSKKGTTSRFVATMNREHGSWRVLSTIPVSGGDK